MDTFRKIGSAKRFADFNISFSPKIYAVQQAHESLLTEQRVYYIGVPYFDHLATIDPAPLQKIILLIDQPLAEQGLLGWTMKEKQTFSKNIAEICQQYNYALYVKPHPLQDTTPWLHLAHNYKIRLIDDLQLLQIIPSVPIVIGFYSTYLMPLAAMPHITLFTLENHPAGKLGVSKPFTDAKVSQPAYNMEELKQLLLNVKKLHQQQLPHKAKFTEDWLYKFDGKSGERLKHVLTNPPFSHIIARHST